MPNILTMRPQDKVGESIRRALPLLPSEARNQIQALLTPESLLIVSGTLVVWAGSHFFGVGEIVDVILLVVGFGMLGLSVFSGAAELFNFAKASLNAHSEADLDRAAQHFARAVNILGISIISALLLRKSAKPVLARGKPRIHSRINVGPPPAPGIKPKITRPLTLPGGALGETDSWGNIAVSRNQTPSEAKLTLYHEWVHSVLSPKLGPLRALRAEISIAGYSRSALLKYIEEALAESYAQLHAIGLQGILVGIRFPLKFKYVSISQLQTEGIAIGTITIEGAFFNVRLVNRPWEVMGQNDH